MERRSLDRAATRRPRSADRSILGLERHGWRQAPQASLPVCSRLPIPLMPGLSRTISATAWRVYPAECPEIFEEMVRLLYRARRANHRFACQVRHKKIFLFLSTPN